MRTPQLKNKELCKFAFVTGLINAVLFGALLPWLFDRNYPLWPYVICVVLVSLALVKPTLLRPVYVGWMALGHMLGWINSRIILGLVFYLIFTPISIILHMLGRDPMECKFQATESYRIPSHVRDGKQMEKPF